MKPFKSKPYKKSNQQKLNKIKPSKYKSKLIKRTLKVMINNMKKYPIKFKSNMDNMIRLLIIKMQDKINQKNISRYKKLIYLIILNLIECSLRTLKRNL